MKKKTNYQSTFDNVALTFQFNFSSPSCWSKIRLSNKEIFWSYSWVLEYIPKGNDRTMMTACRIEDKDMILPRDLRLYSKKFKLIWHFDKFDFEVMFFNMVSMMMTFYTSTKSWRGYIFTTVCLCVCLSVCVCVCVRLFSCEQNSSRTDTPIWTRFSLNGCLAHWLEPYWNWWPWVKGQGHSGSKSFFSS